MTNLVGTRDKVQFVIIGAQKCGTTYLSNILAQHPQVCFSKIKEPFYFNQPQVWAGEGEYHQLFDGSPGQVWGEGSTHYTFLPKYPGVANRIYDYNPKMKLVYMVRHPFERALSLFRFKKIRGETTRSFEEDVMHDPEYLHIGRYYTQLMPYMRRFPRQQIEVIVFEEFIRQKKLFVERLSEFIGIDYLRFPDDVFDAEKNSSVGKKYPPRGINLMRRLTAPLRSVVSPQQIERFKNLLFTDPEPASYTPEFRAGVIQSLEQEVALFEREVLGRSIDVWQR
jgi:hypothetical protein